MPRFSDRLKLFREFVLFARYHRAYWIIPLVIFLGLVALVVVAGQGAAPFIYTLF